MYLGGALLLVLAVLIYLGLAHRALDRLRLSDRAALAFLAVMLIGGLLPDIALGPDWSINIGGGIVPLVLAGYLWSRAERGEIGRSIGAVIIASALVYGLMKVLPTEPTYSYIMDPLYISAVVAAIAGYVAGRSRRGAFIAGTLAILINDIIAGIEAMAMGVSPDIAIGGAGVFDAVIIAGLLALGLAEIFGETREHFATRR